MRDTTIIYRSFYEAIKELPKENQAEVWEAVFEFSLNFKEIALTGLSKTIFTLIKPNIEANIKRYKSGSLPKAKRKGSEKEAKPKQVTSKSEANKDKDNNKEVDKNENKDVEVLSKSKPISAIEVKNYMDELKFGFSKDESEKFFDYYASKGWKVGKETMKDWKAAVRNWIRNKKTDQTQQPEKRIYTPPSLYPEAT